MLSSKRLQTRRVVLHAAMALLRKQGPARVTMEDVARAAGLSRQSVYLHFQNRTKLMLALFAHVGEELGGAEFFRPLPKGVDARALLDTRLRMLAPYAARLHEIALALDIARHHDPIAQAAWNDRMARRRRIIRALVARLAAAGAIRKDWGKERTADAIWALCSPRTYADLVAERAWSLPDYERFLITTARAFLS